MWSITIDNILGSARLLYYVHGWFAWYVQELQALEKMDISDNKSNQ